MALAGVVVVLVVGRRDLDRAGAESAVHHGVGDDRHDSVDERDHRLTAHERGVALVFGVDGDGSVAQQRFGPRGRDRDPGVRVGRTDRFVDQVVSDRPEAARRLLRDHFQVRHARPAARAPVDQGLGPIREAVAIQAQERLADGPGRHFVHREAEAAHVERRADAALLPDDHFSRLTDELPHPLEILLAPQGLPRLAVLGDDLVEDVLGGDGSVVQPGQEERRAALHSGVASHEVFDCRALSVAQVQRAGHVGRRLDDDEGLLAPVGARSLAIRGEDVGIDPALVDGHLDLARPICLGELRLACRACGRAVRLRLRGLGHRLLHALPKSEPARPADERVVVPPAGSASAGVRTSRLPPRVEALSARYRAPSRTARELRSRRSGSGAFSRARSRGRGPVL